MEGEIITVTLPGSDEKLIPGLDKGKKLVKRHQGHSVNMKVRAFGKGFTEFIQLTAPNVLVGQNRHVIRNLPITGFKILCFPYSKLPIQRFFLL